MDVTLRKWRRGQHLRHLSEGDWKPMLDDRGRRLIGIEGRTGVRGLKTDGTAIGCDFIRMQPGAQFPLHVHQGDHEIYFITGKGNVYVDGRDIDVCAGHAIHIPAEYPHAISVPKHYPNPLVFVAVGHPHHHVEARERMRVIDETAAA